MTFGRNETGQNETSYSAPSIRTPFERAINEIFMLLQMVRNYVRKTRSQQCLDRASTEFGLPKATLARYVQTKREAPDHPVNEMSGKFQCIFTERQELELSCYVKDMEKILFGLSQKDLRSSAYQLAERNEIVHNSNRNSEMAGKDWMNGFLKRHSDLSLRQPQELMPWGSIG
ncbi:hypothetical protein JTB14_032606 [Gonioctena quinquepunctata]|nr:hypothetical protein JTB14_032606 [Gonioctena quinquepunctata]